MTSCVPLLPDEPLTRTHGSWPARDACSSQEAEQDIPAAVGLSSASAGACGLAITLIRSAACRGGPKQRRQIQIDLVRCETALGPTTRHVRCVSPRWETTLSVAFHVAFEQGVYLRAGQCCHFGDELQIQPSKLASRLRFCAAGPTRLSPSASDDPCDEQTLGRQRLCVPAFTKERNRICWHIDHALQPSGPLEVSDADPLVCTHQGRD